MSTDTAQPSTRGGAHAPKHAPKTKPKAKKGFFRRFWWVFIVVPVLGVVAVGGALVYAYSQIDLPKALPPIQSTFIYDRDGNLLTSIHGAVDRTVIPIDEMPQHFRDAVIAVEDHGFYDHSGFDPIGIVRAAWTDLVKKEVVQGASTITQQLVKLVYAGTYVEHPDGSTEYVIPPRTIKEKIREVLLAIKVEHELTKDQILARYLNTVYFGNGAYGVQAAAQTYWGIDAGELSVRQSATLAGIITAPSLFDPIAYPEDAERRRDYALDQMVRYGYLDRDEAERLKDKRVLTDPSKQAFRSPLDSEYFVDYTKRVLIKRYGGAQVFGGGLRVTTSLDLELQRVAEEAVNTHLPSPEDPEASLVAIDPATGEILAMVGGREFNESQVNLAVSGAKIGRKTFGGTGRQSGSSFKAFTLAAAMANNYSLNAYWQGPGTITIPDTECYTNGAPWQLSNASDAESGTFSLYSATAHSVNTVFAQVAAQLGPQVVADTAHALGIRSDLQPVCSITLGVEAVNPLEMTNAYATLAARGVRRWATPFVEITNRRGRSIDAVGSRPVQVLDANDADLVTYALEGVISGGTGTAANIGRPAAGKTGTAQEYVDAWFCGYTPQLATCVWMGYPQGEIPMECVEGVCPVFGGTIPAAIWQDFMSIAMAEQPVLDFVPPSFEGYTLGPEHPVASPTPSPSPSPSESPSPEPSESPSPEPSESPSRRSRSRPRAPHPSRARRPEPLDGAPRRRGPDPSGIQGASLTASMRPTGAWSTGRVATIVVPRPGSERTTRVPLASSTRSRIDAKPDPAHSQELSHCARIEPAPVVGDLDPQVLLIGSDGHVDPFRLRMLRHVRERLLDDAVGERLQVVRQLGGERPREPNRQTMVLLEPHERLPQGRDQPAFLEHRRSQTGHQAPEAVRLFGQLATDLREDLHATLGLPGLHHQQGRLERERGRRDALHGAVVEVARDAVAFGLDRRVRPAQQARAVLVAVLEELEERADRLIGHASGRHVAHQQQSPRRRHRHVGDPRLQVQRLPLGAMDRALARRRKRRERLVGPGDRSGECRPGLDPRSMNGPSEPCGRRRRWRAGSCRADRARRSHRPPLRTPGGDAPRIRAASRWPPTRGGARHRSRPGPEPSRPTPIGSPGAPACSAAGSRGCGTRSPCRGS